MRFCASNPTPDLLPVWDFGGTQATGNPLRAHFVHYWKWAFKASHDLGHKCHKCCMYHV